VLSLTAAISFTEYVMLQQLLLLLIDTMHRGGLDVTHGATINKNRSHLSGLLLQ